MSLSGLVGVRGGREGNVNAMLVRLGDDVRSEIWEGETESWFRDLGLMKRDAGR